MTSWVAYARPFAARIAVYRKIINRDPLSEHALRCEDYITAVQWTWAEFRKRLISTPKEGRTP